jgi:hypothetical protein
MAAALIGSGLARVFLTAWVGAHLKQERRTGRSPAEERVAALFKMHRWLQTSTLVLAVGVGAVLLTRLF